MARKKLTAFKQPRRLADKKKKAGVKNSTGSTIPPKKRKKGTAYSVGGIKIKNGTRRKDVNNEFYNICKDVDEAYEKLKTRKPIYKTFEISNHYIPEIPDQDHESTQTDY